MQGLALIAITEFFQILVTAPKAIQRTSNKNGGGGTIIARGTKTMIEK